MFKVINASLAESHPFTIVSGAFVDGTDEGYCFTCFMTIHGWTTVLFDGIDHFFEVSLMAGEVDRVWIICT